MIHSNLKLLLLTTTLWRRHIKCWTADTVTLDFVCLLMKNKTLFPHIQKHLLFLGVYCFLSINILCFICLLLKQHTTISSKTATLCMLSVFWPRATTPLHPHWMNTSSLETAYHQPIASHLHLPTPFAEQWQAAGTFWEQKSPIRPSFLTEGVVPSSPETHRSQM